MAEWPNVCADCGAELQEVRHLGVAYRRCPWVVGRLPGDAVFCGRPYRNPAWRDYPTGLSSSVETVRGRG